MKSKITNDREYGTGAIQILRKRVQIVTKEGDVLDFPRSEFEPPFSDLLAKLEGHRLDPAKYTVSADNSVLYSFAPSTGAHVVRFVNFAAQKDSLPQPKLQTGGPRKGKDGRQWVAPDKLVFTSVLEILTGDFGGCQIIYQLDYIFEKDGKEAMIAGKKGPNAKLSEYLQVLGLDLMTLTIPWPKDGNVLPFLEEEILEADTVFQVVLKDGWIDSVSELPVGFAVPKRKPVALEQTEEDEEPSDEELLAAAKAARAQKKLDESPEAKKALRKAVEAAEDEEDEDVPETKPAKKAGKPVEPDPEEDDEPEEAQLPVSKAAKPAAKVPSDPEPGGEPDDSQEEDTGDDAVDFFSAKASAKRKELDEASGLRAKKIVEDLTGEDEDGKPVAPAKKKRAF